MQRKVVVKSPPAEDAGIWALLGKTRPTGAVEAFDAESALVEHLVTATGAPFTFATKADLETFVKNYNDLFGPSKKDIGTVKPGLTLSNADEKYRAPITKVDVGPLVKGFSNLTSTITINAGEPGEVNIRVYLSHKRHTLSAMMSDLATPIASKLVNIVVGNEPQLVTSMTSFVNKTADRLRARSMLLGYDASQLVAGNPVKVGASTTRQPQAPEEPGWDTEIHAQPLKSGGAISFAQEEMAALSFVARALAGADHDRNLRTSTPRPLHDQNQRDKAAGELKAVARARRQLVTLMGFNDADSSTTIASNFGNAMTAGFNMKKVVDMNKVMIAGYNGLKDRGVVPVVGAAHAKLAPSHNEAMAVWNRCTEETRTKIRLVFLNAGMGATLKEYVERALQQPAPSTLAQQTDAAKKVQSANDVLIPSEIKTAGWQASDTEKVKRFIDAVDAQFGPQARSASSDDPNLAVAHWRH